MKRYLHTLSLATLTAILLSSCVSKQHLDITYYTLETPHISKVTSEPKLSTVLVRDFYVNPNFEDNSFNYQTSDLTYETDFYNQFKISPRSQFTTLTRESLKQSGVFKTVLMPENMTLSDYALEADVQKFMADFRNPKNPQAYLTINFTLTYNPRKGIERTTVFTKTYAEAVPIPQKTAADVAASWSKAYANIARKLVQDLATINPPAPAAPPAPAKSTAQPAANDEPDDSKPPQ